MESNDTSGVVMFPPKSLCVPCNQASLIQTNKKTAPNIERIFPFSGNPGKKSFQLLSCLFILPHLVEANLVQLSQITFQAKWESFSCKFLVISVNITCLISTRSLEGNQLRCTKASTNNPYRPTKLKNQKPLECSV